MKVLCTGATGFIGRHCLTRLRDAGYEVCAVSSRPIAGGVLDDVDWRQIDLLRTEQVRALISEVRPSHLLHLAWITTPGIYWTSPENLRWAAATLDLVRLFAEHGGHRAVVAGSCAEYDWHHTIYSERDTPRRPATLYGACKSGVGSIVEAFATQTGLSTAWGRIFFTFGPGEHSARLVPSVIGRLLLQKPAPCTQGTQVRDLLFVDDVADAFVTLLGSAVSGPVNIGSGTGVAIRDVVLQIARRLNAESLVQFGARMAPTDEPPHIVADIARLRQSGWTPPDSVNVGLDATIAWWQEQFASGAAEPDDFN